MITKQISFGVEAQLQAVKELLAEEVNGIAMTPYNDERIRDCINTLYEQGIPVVTLNTDIENSRRLAYVGSNYTRSGATAAGLLQLMTSGMVNIGIVTGSSKILCHTERIAGFLKTLAPYRNRIHVVDTVEIHDDEVESYEKTTALLSKHPEINALFLLPAVSTAVAAVWKPWREKIPSGSLLSIWFLPRDRCWKMTPLPLLSANSQRSRAANPFPCCSPI